MSFEDTFCPSPWIHMRINTDGVYEYCRWAKTPRWDKSIDHAGLPGIANMPPAYYFQYYMSGIRNELLTGAAPAGCQDCYVQDQHKKPSGRMRQLLKIGVQGDSFDKGLLSSPFADELIFSAKNFGTTTLMPVDWQIDLGNYCNSACLFCHPSSSSMLATDWLKAGLIDQVPPNSWCNDPAKLEEFVQVLIDTPNLKYLHFIGGETLITPAFKTILQRLVDAGKSKTITVGFTTNLTVWMRGTVDLLDQFEQINLGLSIEALDPVNDYARYPSNVDHIKLMLDDWVKLAKEKGWLVQLRTTPTILTVNKLDTIYDYAFERGVSVESCNFLADPVYMRPSVLPPAERKAAIHKLQQWVNEHKKESVKHIINTRDPNVVYDQIIQDAESYIQYLHKQPDESEQLPVLVEYLKQMESIRGNSVLDYLPEYEDLFRAAGY